MNYKLLIILLGLATIAAFGIYLFTKDSEEEITNFDECILAGNMILESYPRQCRTEDGVSFTEDIGDILEKSDLVKSVYPIPNETVTSPLEITGEARGYWFFEGSFPVRIEDSEGNVLGELFAQAQTEWMTEEFVPFKATLTFTDPITKKGNLFLVKDNPSGLPEYADELRIPVFFGEPTEKITVRAYFNNNDMDPEFSCNKVFPVERQIAKTEAVGMAALEELLRGATIQEQQQGFFTSINPGVVVESLIIEKGIAKVEFDEQLEFQVGGSCRVSAIRAQIVETLKQFSTVNEVVISINGRTEDILQP